MLNLILLMAGAGRFGWHPQISNSQASLRGLCVVSPRVVWASGTNGTFLRTIDGGEHWSVGTVSGAEELDFRDVEAFDDRTAFLLASGDGDHSAVYRTNDGGQYWALLLRNPDAKGFFDALAFWDKEHGILLGDPVDGHFVVYRTDDGGAHWKRENGPRATRDEGAFAASGTALITKGTNEAWFASGGPEGARVFYTHDRGATWRITQAPLGGEKTAGIFSIAMRDSKRGVVVGGDYKKPKAEERVAAWTEDGGKSWHASSGAGYQSGVSPIGISRQWIAVGSKGSAVSRDGGRTWQRFSDMDLNAVGCSGDAVFAVGPKGVVVKLEGQP